MAAQVLAEHCGVGKVLIRQNNCPVCARNMGHWTVPGQTACTVRESSERTRGDRIWEV